MHSIHRALLGVAVQMAGPKNQNKRDTHHHLRHWATLASQGVTGGEGLGPWVSEPLRPRGSWTYPCLPPPGGRGASPPSPPIGEDPGRGASAGHVLTAVYVRESAGGGTEGATGAFRARVLREAVHK